MSRCKSRLSVVRENDAGAGLTRLAFIALQKLSSQSVTPRYCKLFEELKNGPWSKDVADLTNEGSRADAMDVDA